MISTRSRASGAGLSVSALALALAIPALAGHLSGYPAPTGLVAETVAGGGDGNLDDVALAWSSYADFPAGCTQAREIRIFRSTDGGAPEQIFAASSSTTSYLDEDLAEGSHTYSVQARCNVPNIPGPGGTPTDTNNLSLFSSTATAIVSSAPPCAGPPVIEATATPTTLWPPNGKMVSVNVTGTVTPQQNCAMPAAVGYAVIDEYDALTVGPVEVSLDSGAFQFQVQLEASRYGHDMDGRLYGIEVFTEDGGAHGFDAVVPHDQRKK